MHAFITDIDYIHLVMWGRRVDVNVIENLLKITLT